MIPVDFRNKDVLESVSNREEIINEVIKYTNGFSTVENITLKSNIDSLEIENLEAYRGSVEYRFGIFIMNYEWEQLKTIKDIVDAIEPKIMITEIC